MQALNQNLEGQQLRDAGMGNFEVPLEWLASTPDMTWFLEKNALAGLGENLDFEDYNFFAEEVASWERAPLCIRLMDSEFVLCAVEIRL